MTRSFFVLCVAALALAPHTARASNLDAALQHRGLKGAALGVLVVDRSSRRDVFSRNADTPMIAASNVKILTALAALDTFGPSHRFITEVYADKKPDREGVVGRIVLQGGGDPSLTSEQMWRLAADLARKGVRKVDGPVVLDATAFDDVRWHPAWGKTSARAYHAPVAALNVNYGAFTVEVTPGTSNQAAARVTVDPPIPYFSPRWAVTTVAKGGKLSVDRVSRPGGDRVSARGTIRRDSKPRPFYRSVTRPVQYAGQVFRQQLQANGITTGEMRVGAVAQSDVSILRFEGKPLSEVVRLFMKYSNNNIAETLVKAMGRHATNAQGTWDNGAVAMRTRLLAMGLGPSGLSLVDGSGLARANRVSPRVLVEALAKGLSSFTYGPEFASALPLAARDGTLKKRATQARDRARAKTGLLTGATALSGVVRTKSGRDLLFSIVANGYANGDASAMAALDGFAAALTKQ